MKVFYSKNLPDNHFFFNQETQIEWVCQSLIEIHPLEFKFPQQTHKWIFFSSANGVKIFMTKEGADLSKYQIGCLGSATAEALPSSIHANFIGTGSTEEIAEEFKFKVGLDTCLFIESQQGINNIQTKFDPSQIQSIIAYQTIGKAITVPTCDCYFFTSPSNVKSYLKSNSIEDLKNVIALGKTTQQVLSDLRIPSCIPNSYQHSDQFKAIIAQTHSL